MCCCCCCCGVETSHEGEAEAIWGGTSSELCNRSKIFCADKDGLTIWVGVPLRLLCRLPKLWTRSSLLDEAGCVRKYESLSSSSSSSSSSSLSCSSLSCSSLLLSSSKNSYFRVKASIFGVFIMGVLAVTVLARVLACGGLAASDTSTSPVLLVRRTSN